MTAEGTAGAAGGASSTRGAPAAAVVHPSAARSRGYQRAAGTPAGDALPRARARRAAAPGGSGAGPGAGRRRGRAVALPRAPEARSPPCPRYAHLPARRTGKGEMAPRAGTFSPLSLQLLLLKSTQNSKRICVLLRATHDCYLNAKGAPPASRPASAAPKAGTQEKPPPPLARG